MLQHTPAPLHYYIHSVLELSKLCFPASLLKKKIHAFRKEKAELQHFTYIYCILYFVCDCCVFAPAVILEHLTQFTNCSRKIAWYIDFFFLSDIPVIGLNHLWFTCAMAKWQPFWIGKAMIPAGCQFPVKFHISFGPSLKCASSLANINVPKAERGRQAPSAK